MNTQSLRYRTDPSILHKSEVVIILYFRSNKLLQCPHKTQSQTTNKAQRYPHFVSAQLPVAIVVGCTTHITLLIFVHPEYASFDIICLIRIYDHTRPGKGWQPSGCPLH